MQLSGIQSAMLIGDDLDLSSEALPEMDYRVSSVSSKGGISATFQVPGAITVPSDGAAPSVTVARLTLDASMSWVTVPKLTLRPI